MTFLQQFRVYFWEEEDAGLSPSLPPLSGLRTGASVKLVVFANDRNKWIAITTQALVRHGNIVIYYRQPDLYGSVHKLRTPYYVV